MEEIVIREYQEYQENEVLSLYRKAGWTNYIDRLEMLCNAFAGSLCTLGAYDGETLVGIIRAVGDGASVVFVQDILVDPEYQRKGIGTALVKALQERYQDVYQFHLITDDTPETIAFYSSLGFFNLVELGCRGFTWINRA